MGRIFLEEVQALDGDFGLIRPTPAEFESAALDDGSGLANDEELRNRTLRHRFSVALNDGHYIGGFAVDGDLTRPNQRRKPGFPLEERRAEGGHFLLAQLAQNASGQHSFHEEIFVEDHLLTLWRA